LQRLIEVEPGNSRYWYMLSPILLHLGDEEGYRMHCRRMLDAFGDSPNPHALQDVVAAYSIGPDAVNDKLRIGQVAARWLKAKNLAIWPKYLRGLVEYRQGNDREAVKWLNESLKTDGKLPYLAVPARLALAMSHAQLSEIEQARFQLAVAQKTMDSYLRKPDAGELGAAWSGLLICWILRAEAEKVVAELGGIAAGDETGSTIP
jgi:hypothetical protein